jgi:TonB family protein
MRAIHSLSLTLLAACASTPTAASTPTSTPTPNSTSNATAISTASGAPAQTPIVRIGDVASPPNFDVTGTLRELVLPQLTSCYSDALAASPGLHGKMVLSFEVNEQGVVTSATELKSTTNSPSLFACIKAAVIATAFTKPGGTATVNVPLVFRP